MVKGNSHIKKVSINDAIKAIKEGAGKQYDPNLVEKFLDVIQAEETA